MAQISKVKMSKLAVTLMRAGSTHAYPQRAGFAIKYGFA